MWTQFILQNAHFALNIFAALVFFAVCWLYYDAWSLRKKDYLTGVRAIGFLLLSLSYLAHAATVETTFLSTALLSDNILEILIPILRTVSYGLIITTLALEPLMPKPKITDPYAPPTSNGTAGAWWPYLGMGYPVYAIATACLYWRRATTGLERHLKPPAISFLIVGIGELFGLAEFGRHTTNIDVYNLVAPFGLLWMISHICLLAAMVVLVRWVFGYLLKRFETQLFFIFTTTIVIIFLFITIAFTSILTQNLSAASMSRLSTDAKVLSYAIDSKKAASLSDAQVIARDPQVVSSVMKSDRKILTEITGRVILGKKQSFLVIVNKNAQVLVRGENPDRYGDSLSSDSLVARALANESLTSLEVHEGVIAPEISVRAATPIVDGTTVVGAVLVGTQLDNAFLDGINKSTGLEASLYGGAQLSATTFKTADGVTRPVGITLPGWKVRQTVVDRGQMYTGSINLMNRPYFAAFMPLSDHTKTVLGMVSVAEPQLSILTTVGHSIEMTFLVAIILLVISVFPSYYISKYLAKQI